jgi:sugar/nucleoside kinase (ribokinase family)
MSPVRRPEQRVLTSGYVTLDLIVRDVIPQDYWDAVGGTCGNVSAFLAALGADVSLLARVGFDRRGRRLLSRLKATGVDVSQIERVERLPTPGIVVNIGGDNRKGHRFSFECPLCGSHLPKVGVVSSRRAKIVASQIEDYDVFFFDRATAATIALAEAARGAGLLVVYEPTSIPRTEYAHRATALSDVVKVSEQMNQSMDDWQPASGSSTRFITETLGERGVRFRHRLAGTWSKWTQLPAIKQCCISDTVGAGDWLTAGMLKALLDHSGDMDENAFRKALEFGQGLSALSLAFHGPHGALGALPPATIVHLAQEAALARVAPDVSSTTKARRWPAAPGHCRLCFSATV